MNGITLNFVGGANECVEDPTRMYSLKVNIMCDHNVNGITSENVGGDSCEMELNYRSNKGCAIFEMNKFFRFMNKYYYLWGAGFILLGIFLAFFGNKFVDAVIFIFGAIVTFLVIASVLFQLFMKNVQKQWI